MAESKYARHVLVNPEPQSMRDDPPAIIPDHVGRITSAFTYSNKLNPDTKIWCHPYLIYKPGGVFGHANEVIAKKGEKAGQVVSRLGVHSHPTADEYFFFVGTDPKDPSDLGGEYEFWLGEGEDSEKFIFDKATAIHVPAGLAHNPNVARRVDRPFYMIVVLLQSAHSADQREAVNPYFKP
jgi:hypothetical protein